jgi:YD repeat-containing protein
LLGSGYDDGISIEPHMATIFHKNPEDADEQQMRNTYIEYGRRLEKMMTQIQEELKAET